MFCFVFVESTSRFLSEHNEDKVFVETSVFHEAKDLLEKNRFVLLSGHRGEGKSTMATRLALTVSKPSRCLVLQEPSNWLYVDLSLNLIETIIIDDLYGNISLKQKSVAEWAEKLKDIHKASKERGIYVIITCVTYIFKQSDEELWTIKHVLDNDEIFICQLSSSKLSRTERIGILKAHAKKCSRNLSESMILECVVQSSGPGEAFVSGYPQQAAEFCSKDPLYKLKSEYFKAPMHNVMKYLKDMYVRGSCDEDRLKFLALVLVWAKKERKFNESELGMRTEYVRYMLNLFGLAPRANIIETIHPSLESHIGGFLKYNQRTGDFSFSHSTISDVVGLVLGKKRKDIVIKACLRDFLMQYITVVDCDRASDEFKIVVNEGMFPCLVEKCCDMLLKPEDNAIDTDGEFVWLERYGKHGNTLYVWNHIDYGIIRHNAFKSRTFVKQFLRHVQSKALLNKVFCRSVLTMSGRFLDYGISVKELNMRLLDYAIFRGENEFTAGVIEAGIVDRNTIDLEMALLLAIHSKRIPLIELLLDLGARITGDAIHIAVCRSTDVLKMLVRQPEVEINDPGNAVNSNYPLIIAAKNGSYDAVKCLLRAGADPSVRNTMNMTALHKAILFTDSDVKRQKIVELLVDYGAPLDIRGGARKQTPLHIAVSLGEPVLVQTLIRYGASLHTRDHEGAFPVHTAVLNGNDKIVEILIQRDRSQETLRMSFDKRLHRYVHRGEPIQKGFSLFHIAVWKKQAMLDTLISLGVDPNVKDCYGRTPLLYAIEKKLLKHVWKLLQYSKVDKSHADKQGRTPLHMALQNDLHSIATQLIPHSNINAKTKSGETALHIACAMLNINITDCLLRHVADFRMVTNDGDTVFHILARNTDRLASHFVQFFLQLDPDIVHCLSHLKDDGQNLNLSLIKTGYSRIASLKEYLATVFSIHSKRSSPRLRRSTVYQNFNVLGLSQ